MVISIPNHPCTQCNKVFKSSGCLKSHENGQHPKSDVPLFSCNDCTYATNYKSNLYKHIDKKHIEGTAFNARKTTRKAHGSFI